MGNKKIIREKIIRQPVKGLEVQVSGKYQRNTQPKQITDIMLFLEKLWDQPQEVHINSNEDTEVKQQRKQVINGFYFVMKGKNISNGKKRKQPKQDM